MPTNFQNWPFSAAHRRQPNSDSFILGLRINPLCYASVAHRTDEVVAQALGVAFEALV
jgi:hypothetical protein